MELIQVVDQKSGIAISTIDYHKQFQPIKFKQQIAKQVNNNRKQKATPANHIQYTNVFNRR